MPVLTLNWAPGTHGDEIAKRLEQKLGIPVYERFSTMRDMLGDLATDYDVRLLDESPKNFLRQAKNGLTFKENIANILMEYADRHDYIYLGVVPALFLATHPNALHIRIVAPEELRYQRLLRVRGSTHESTMNQINQSDKNIKRYGKVLFDEESKDPFLYHLTINTGKVSVDAAVLMIYELYLDHMAKEILFDTKDEGDKVKHRNEESTLMKNESEIQFAKILDMYSIRWMYEPNTFELERDADGNVTSAFSPDFYLPDYDVFLELTVMNPKYMTEKRQKVKELQALYPDINVKLVQRKDFDHFSRVLHRSSTHLTGSREKGEK